jgi:hypothetical protein
MGRCKGMDEGGATPTSFPAVGDHQSIWGSFQSSSEPLDHVVTAPGPVYAWICPTIGKLFAGTEMQILQIHYFTRLMPSGRGYAIPEQRREERPLPSKAPVRVRIFSTGAFHPLVNRVFANDAQTRSLRQLQIHLDGYPTQRLYGHATTGELGPGR